MVKLLAVGDQHFGARADLGHKPGERLAEQETVWEWTLSQAREREVDAILHAGDWFESRKPDPEVILAAERPLVKHHQLGGPPVFSIVGNHCLSGTATDCAPDVFAEAGLIQLERRPRVVLVDGGCLVAVLPWAPTSRLAANFDGPRDELNAHAAALLIDAARELYENAHAEAARMNFVFSQTPPIILLTHFAISSTSLPSGLDVGQLREPVLPADELEAIGFDWIIAGHIHRPQLIGNRGLYVGSPMPLNFGEADGQPRGPWILTLGEPGTSGAGPGSLSVGLEHLPAPSRAFVNVEAAEVFEGHDVAGAYVKLRVHDEGTDVPALRDALLAMGAHRVFVDLKVERAVRARDASVDDAMDEGTALLRWMEAQNGAVSAELAGRALERAQDILERASR